MYNRNFLTFNKIIIEMNKKLEIISKIEGFSDKKKQRRRCSYKLDLICSFRMIIVILRKFTRDIKCIISASRSSLFVE